MAKVQVPPLSRAKITLRTTLRASPAPRATRPRRGKGRGMGMRWRRGLAYEDIAAAATGTVKILAGPPGDESETGQQVEAYNDTDVDIASGARVLLYNLGFGWYVLPLENGCE